MSKYKVHERKGRFYVLGPGMEAHEARSFLFAGDAEAYRSELDEIDEELGQFQSDVDAIEEEEDEDEAAAKKLEETGPPVKINPGGPKK